MNMVIWWVLVVFLAVPFYSQPARAQQKNGKISAPKGGTAVVTPGSRQIGQGRYEVTSCGSAGKEAWHNEATSACEGSFDIVSLDSVRCPKGPGYKGIVKCSDASLSIHSEDRTTGPSSMVLDPDRNATSSGPSSGVKRNALDLQQQVDVELDWVFQKIDE